MTARPTITDVARTAGVSVATVDRVLNGRHPVREQTARRVYDAATAIGYHAVGLIRQRLRQDLKRYQLGFVLQKPEQTFFQTFAAELERVAAAEPGMRIDAHVDFTESQTPADVIAKLREAGARSQAVAMVAPDHPMLAAAVQELKDRGVPVFSLLSDFASGIREGYIGVNNRKAGRTAGWVIARTAKRPGKVAVFVGSHRFHGHELREIGFRAYLREHGPDFQVLDTLINLETPQITYEATLDLLQRHPDLVGLYVAGAGMEGAIAALREENAAGRIVAVCNELIPETRAALADDVITAVIATPLQQICADLVPMMVEAIEAGVSETTSQTFLPFALYVSENI